MAKFDQRIPAQSGSTYPFLKIDRLTMVIQENLVRKTMTPSALL
jgi:hypothetical protein